MPDAYKLSTGYGIGGALWPNIAQLAKKIEELGGRPLFEALDREANPPAPAPTTPSAALAPPLLQVLLEYQTLESNDLTW